MKFTRNFYVDDGLASVDTEAKAIQLVKEARDHCNTGKLHLRKFITNSKRVITTIPKEECTEGATDFGLSGEVHCSLVMGKARVAPTRVATIHNKEVDERDPELKEAQVLTTKAKEEMSLSDCLQGLNVVRGV